MKVLRIICRVDGDSADAGKYVKSFDPSLHSSDGGYDGGRLELTLDPGEAQKFPDAVTAMNFWKTPAPCACHRVRPWDGKLNRPLTAFNVAVVTL